MEQLPVSLLSLALAGYVGAALAALLCLRSEKAANLLAFGGGSLAALCGLISAVAALTTGVAEASPRIQVLPSLIPYVQFSARLDALSMFFILIVSLVGLALSIYSLGYARGFYGRKNVGVLGAFFNTLLLATNLVLIADNAFFFLIAWEIMALAAYCLVSFEHEQEETRRAGVLYFVMSHIGTGCIMLGFLLLFQATGHYSFAGFHTLGEKMSSGSRNAASLLFLVGFGVIPGLVPL